MSYIIHYCDEVPQEYTTFHFHSNTTSERASTSYKHNRLFNTLKQRMPSRDNGGIPCHSAIRYLRSRVICIPMPGKRSWRRIPIRPMCTFRFAVEISIYAVLLIFLLPWRKRTKPGPAGERAYDNRLPPTTLCRILGAVEDMPTADSDGLSCRNHASLGIEKNRDNTRASQAMRSMTPWIARRTPSSV